MTMKNSSSSIKTHFQALINGYSISHERLSKYRPVLGETMMRLKNSRIFNYSNNVTLHTVRLCGSDKYKL